MGASFCVLNEPTLDRPSVGGDAHTPPFYRRTLARPFVGGDALIAPPRPPARKTLASLCEGGGRDGRGRTPPLRTSTERAPRSFPVIPRSEATWESVLLFASGGLFSFSSERKEEKKRRQKLRFWISLRGFTWFLFCLLLPHERCSVQISPKVTPHNGTRAICEQILRTDEARFRSNTCRIARNRNKVRTQNFRKAPQFSLCGVALNVALSLLLGALPLLL